MERERQKVDPHRPLRCIDYAPVHFAAAGEAVPEEHKGKFVVLDGPKESYFILSPKQLSKYHANIIERFCAYDGGPAYNMNESGEHCTLLDGSWTIRGGGKYVWSRPSRTLRIGGTSMAYGPVDCNYLCGRLSVVDTFIGYHIMAAEL